MPLVQDAGQRRRDYLQLSWEDQKKTDLRRVFDPDNEDVNLTANCIQPLHQDDSASMVIYTNGVWCFGCRTRLWPDQFLRSLGDKPLGFERGAHKMPPPKFIPLGQVDTYRHWLYAQDGHYKHRQGWLKNRGLTRDICYDNFLGHTGEAFSIPIFGDGGQVKAVRYRRDDELACEDRPKYWGTTGANDVLLYFPRRSLGSKDNHQYGLLLAEGELDALRLRQEGYPAASLTNGCNALKVEHLPQLWALVYSLGVNRITVCYDQDEPGRNAAYQALSLGGFNSSNSRMVTWDRIILGVKDVTEFIQKYDTSYFGEKLEQAWR